jgi:hypothetical protein
VSGASVGDGDAFALSVEDPQVGASQTDLIVPVPSTASEIGRLGVVEAREDALAILEVVSFEASQAVSIVGIGCAKVRDSDAFFVSVENPFARASQADLTVPVPGSAAKISGLSIVEVGEDAFTILEVIALVASSAVAASSVGFALVGNGETDVLGVEDPMAGAG